MSTEKKYKLNIATCTLDKGGKITVDQNNAFEFMLNPSEYDHSFSIGYNQVKSVGQLASDSRFSGVKPERIKFKTLLDGTGVVAIHGEKNPDVKAQIKALKAIVYDYDGNIHEPNYVRVLWGSQIFYGRLESMSVDSTLFKPNGEPLRAMLEMAFTGFMSKEEEALRANRSSPDLSHQVVVRAGDTLPLLCERIYKDSSYYLEVARVNGLTNFRELQLGSKLHFPPLR